MTSLEQQLQDLDDAEAQRAQDVVRRAALVQQIAVEREQAAQAAAERWSHDNVLAVKKLDGQLDELLGRLVKNPNQRDAVAANKVWDLIRARLELHDVLRRRCPSAELAVAPSLAAPGRRGLTIVGLSIEGPRAQLFPLVVASDSGALRLAIFARAAWEWLRDRGATLPAELQATVAAEVPPADLQERMERQAAERRQMRGIKA